MVDAVGKLPSGLLLGNTHWIGMYEECIKVSSKHPDARQPDNSTILGHHCLVNVGDDTPGSNVSVGNILNEWHRLFSAPLTFSSYRPMVYRLLKSILTKFIVITYIQFRINLFRICRLAI